jgi:hypothetical protein
MPYAARNPLPTKPQVLCSHDLVQIARAADLLPGGWTVDPVADIRQVGAPRVWIHPAHENTIAISIGFSIRGSIFHMLVRHHDEPDTIQREEIEFDYLATMFSKLAVLLTMLHEEQQYSDSNAGVLCDPKIESAKS